jgi:hypothetical protein
MKMQEHRIRQIFARHFSSSQHPCVNSLADKLVPLEARLSSLALRSAQTFLSPHFPNMLRPPGRDIGSILATIGKIKITAVRDQLRRMHSLGRTKVVYDRPKTARG